MRLFLMAVQNLSTWCFPSQPKCNSRSLFLHCRQFSGSKRRDKTQFSASTSEKSRDPEPFVSLATDGISHTLGRLLQVQSFLCFALAITFH
jgi:hypothetical protein